MLLYGSLVKKEERRAGSEYSHESHIIRFVPKGEERWHILVRGRKYIANLAEINAWHEDYDCKFCVRVCVCVPFLS